MSWQKSKKAKPKSKKNRSLFKRLFLFLISIIGITSAGIAGLFLLLFYNAPSLEDLYKDFRKPAIIIKDQKGNILGTYGDYFTHVVTLKTLPKYVPQAFLAVEDRRFYQHYGIDFMSILRAFLKNKMAGRVVQGGSSLTQQLAKQILVSNKYFDYKDQSYRRKLQEAFLAFQLERKLSKDEILTLYLNRVYFGSGAYGIDAASKHYFKKPAEELTVFEAALLAGLLKAPSKYSPHSNQKLCLARTQTILKLMQECGYIDDAQKALKQQGTYELPDRNLRFFTDWIYDSISLYIDPNQLEDIEVITTFDKDLQKKAVDACHKVMNAEGYKLGIKEVAFVTMTPSGAIKTMIGGINHAISQFNRVTQSQRQAGSVIKPLIYLAALENGFSIYDYMNDEPYSKGTWHPSNFHWKTRGSVTLLEALVYSANAVTIRIAEAIGIPRVKGMLEKMGIFTHQPDNLTIALGSGDINIMDITAAYGSFANDGYLANPYGIIMIKNKKGDILYQRIETKGKKIMSNTSLEQMRLALKEIVQRGSGRGAKVAEYISGKTGSNRDCDAWFVGYYEKDNLSYDPSLDHSSENENIFVNSNHEISTSHEKLAFGVWVGNDKNEDMHKKSLGGRVPAHIIREFFTNFV